MYAFINDDENLEVRISGNDSCYFCKNIYKCPLIQSITKEYVIMHYSEMEVTKCGLFKRK